MNMPTTANTPMPQQQDQLHDIQLPEQISNFPIAPGWWILTLACLIFCYYLIRFIKKKNRLNANKKKALSLLAENPTMPAKDSLALLKWAAMQYFPRSQVAMLYGNSFVAFLSDQLPQSQQSDFKELVKQGVNQQYQRTDTTESNDINENSDTCNSADNTTSEQQLADNNCYKAAKLWLTHALPVKTGDKHVQITQQEVKHD